MLVASVASRSSARANGKAAAASGSAPLTLTASDDSDREEREASGDDSDADCEEAARLMGEGVSVLGVAVSGGRLLRGRKEEAAAAALGEDALLPSADRPAGRKKSEGVKGESLLAASSALRCGVRKAAVKAEEAEGEDDAANSGACRLRVKPAARAAAGDVRLLAESRRKKEELRLPKPPSAAAAPD